MANVALVEKTSSRTDFIRHFENDFEFDRYQLCSDTTKKKIYSKIPRGDNKTSYTDKFRKDLRSYNPYRRVEIIKARVYSNDSFK